MLVESVLLQYFPFPSDFQRKLFLLTCIASLWEYFRIPSSLLVQMMTHLSAPPEANLKHAKFNTDFPRKIHFKSTSFHLLRMLRSRRCPCAPLAAEWGSRRRCRTQARAGRQRPPAAGGSTNCHLFIFDGWTIKHDTNFLFPRKKTFFCDIGKKQLISVGEAPMKSIFLKKTKENGTKSYGDTFRALFWA